MRRDVETIEVRISKRVLWVGQAAYPLPNVTQVELVEFRANRWRAVRRFLRDSRAPIALGCLALLLLGCASAPAAVFNAVALVVLLVEGILVYRLARWLTLRPLYVLRVQMAGASRAAVVSRDKPKIDELRFRVVEAIDNPASEYKVWIDNIVGGDLIHGDAIGGDKLVNGDKTVYQAG